MKKILEKIKMKNILLIILGSAIYAFGLVYFNMQNNLAEGGFTGIALLLYFLFAINPSISTLVLNIPVFILGWKYLGRKSFFYTMIGTVTLSVFLEIFQHYQISIPIDHDMTLAALFAGVFAGGGLGIIFRSGGTTGGVDIITRLVQKFIGLPIGRTMFLFDATVITISIIAYLTPREGMYTLVAVFIAAKIIDFIQEGAYSGRGVFIISDKYAEIAEKISSDLYRGVTALEGQGYYTKATKKVLYCVVAKREVITLKNIVNEVDPHAFVTITHVHEVLGEGFTFDENKNPLHI